VIASQTLLLHILNLSVPNLDRAFALQVTFTTRQEQFAKKFVEMGYFLICNAMMEIWMLEMDVIHYVKFKRVTVV
jgi:hypothetical protein